MYVLVCVLVCVYVVNIIIIIIIIIALLYSFLLLFSLIVAAISFTHSYIINIYHKHILVAIAALTSNSQAKLSIYYISLFGLQRMYTQL